VKRFRFFLTYVYSPVLHSRKREKPMKTLSWITLLSVFLAAVALPAVAAEVKILCTHAFKEAVVEAGAQFEKRTGNKLSVIYGTTGDIVKRVNSGETPDVVFASAAALQGLATAGKVVAGSNVPVARTGIGISVRTGAPKPDIGSVEALKRSLLAAKSIAYSDPKDGGTSGIHFAQVIQRLGIAEQLQPKTILVGSGGNVGEVVAKGEAEIAVQMITELLPVRGTQYVGPLPGELQNMIVFAGGVGAGGKQPEAGSAFIKFLLSPQGIRIMKSTGLEPVPPAKQ
jgi:molybdate transport system substrate-binding protein